MPTVRHLAAKVLPELLVEHVRQRPMRRQRKVWEQRLGTAPEEFAEAYAQYWVTGEVPADAGEKLFLATWSSSGTFPRSQPARHAKSFEPAKYAGFSDDLLRDIDPVTVANAVQKQGFYVAPKQLSAPVVDDILAVLESGPAQPRGDGLEDLTPGVPRPTAPTWWMYPSDSVRSESVRRLLRERRLAEVGGHYLGVDPMVMSVVLWKSFAWQASDKHSAQQFHYDGDRAAFIKMFVYLSDVDLANGPHTYVPGSHRDKPRELLHGDRLSDDQVARHYPKDRWQVITGPKGTVFFADTQGFHKGGRVEQGSRAMFQINLASDRFGVHEPPIGPVDAAPGDLRAVVEGAPRYFSELFVPDQMVP